MKRAALEPALNVCGESHAWNVDFSIIVCGLQFNISKERMHVQTYVNNYKFQACDTLQTFNTGFRPIQYSLLNLSLLSLISNRDRAPVYSNEDMFKGHYSDFYVPGLFYIPPSGGYCW